MKMANYSNELRLTLNRSWVSKKTYDELYSKAFQKDSVLDRSALIEDLGKSGIQEDATLNRSALKSSIFM